MEINIWNNVLQRKKFNNFERNHTKIFGYSYTGAFMKKEIFSDVFKDN